MENKNIYKGLDRITLFCKRNTFYDNQSKRDRWNSLIISINTDNKDYYYLIFYYSADCCPGIGIWHYIIEKTPQFTPKFTLKFFEGNNYSDPEKELDKVLDKFNFKWKSIYNKIESILYRRK